MKLNHFLHSSIGQKILMATTGLFLIVFLLVHCYVNANVLLVNGEENFNRAAHFMSTNLLVRVSEVVLFLGLILHVYKGLSLYFYNKGKRRVGYRVSAPSDHGTWYSRSMTLLGTLILFFLIVHLANFWVPSRFMHLEEAKYQNGTIVVHNLYVKMQEVFSNIYIVVLYVLGCVSLSWHLLHGFQSAFRTFGLLNKGYFGLVSLVGVLFSVFVPLIFALMPVFMYLGYEVDLKAITLLF